ncbi:hairy-related 11 [Alosa sapidissima]|uniref:hairy-related 11 n=1 Tax=Alosa sapidissima TaxID=34773 RepID=UPI001C0A28CB|nr:hairy-related 11 [Alosa sapidissima]
MKNSDVNKSKCLKRVLKPVIEKKRRDRINQNLHELRVLLLRCTKDTRLQNPKLEKAEILDLAVQYLRRDTEKHCKRNEPGSQHPPDEEVNPEISVSGLQAPHAQFSSVYTAGFHHCLTNVSSFMTNTGSSEVDPKVNKLKVRLDGHFTNSGHQGHGKERQLHPTDAPTSRCPDSPPVSEQMTPPHSPFLSHSTPAAHPSISCEPSFSHKASLHSLDTYRHSPSSSSLVTTYCSLSRLTPFHSPSPMRRHAVGPNSTSSTWRPWN